MKHTHYKTWLRISVQYMVATLIIYFVIAFTCYFFIRYPIRFNINNNYKH